MENKLEKIIVDQINFLHELSKQCGQESLNNLGYLSDKIAKLALVVRVIRQDNSLSALEVLENQQDGVV